MTTITFRTGKCFICGHKGLFPHMASTNQFGSPDLDMRPPEMLRSTMDMWVQCCDECGYCAPVISKGSPNVNSVINSAEYIKQKSDYVIPKLANQFLRWFIIERSTGHPAEAGWAALNAAWVCDDHDKVTEARHCREKAIDLFHGARKVGISFADDEASESAILIDLLRICGQFQGANAMCEKALKRESVPILKDLVLFQIDLIEKKDINNHCFDEIVEQPHW
ncbi:hypothetical protein [uncultured Desulfosarcina sp.]|uniref:hypothetical protein n=1 Tax=uncultured Desulfosarcina sp. TaxID=218289 RepID=UPI0029C70D82|nr:hypothetical protein [uncultured Desulfosarcina sp.]